MDKRQLGTSDLQITPIGFGAWAIGGPDYAFGWGAQDDDASVAAIGEPSTPASTGLTRPPSTVWPVRARCRAGAQGDGAVAPAVCVHEVLARVGRARRDLHSLKAASVRQELEDSLRRLETDVIDLYQIDWSKTWGLAEPAPDIEEGWSTLAALQREGKVRHIAVSNFDIAELDRIRPIAPVASLQPPYSILRRGIESDLLPYCLANRIGVIVYSPMAAGILSGAMTRERAMSLPANDWRSKNPEYQEPRLARNLALVEHLRRIGARYGTSPGAVAISWTLRQPAVTGAIVGFRSARQVDGLVAAASLRLEPGEIVQVDELTQTAG